MIKKYKPHNCHKNQKYDTYQEHPFYQSGEVGFFFHQKNLSESVNITGIILL